MWNLLTMKSVTFAPGILLRTSIDSDVVHLHANSQSNLVMRELASQIFNGSRLLNIHLIMSGQDHYYLMKENSPDPELLSKLKQYHLLLNYTLQEVDFDHSVDQDKNMVCSFLFVCHVFKL